MNPHQEKQLAWNPVGIDGKLRALLDTVRATKARTPRNNTRLLGKIGRWILGLDSIVSSLSKIHESLAPMLEGVLGLPIAGNELLSVAMFQPSTRNLFLEIETHYRGTADESVKPEVFTDLASLSDMAKVLALVGDAAISMAVLHHLWLPSFSNAGLLTQRRAELVSNEHLAWLCDHWGLYEHRIHFDPPSSTRSEMDHIKGTLLESMYGIVYVEFGLNEVKKLIHHLETPPM
ncbi:MAG: hypothetical protein C4K49_02430 [Candidatus Thorarchaeota archaeon]|nr:MAG: hypothetical protein C4K49_02430 [Candidatus Thorarchaeota archaeon]